MQSFTVELLLHTANFGVVVVESIWEVDEESITVRATREVFTIHKGKAEGTPSIPGFWGFRRISSANQPADPP